MRIRSILRFALACSGLSLATGWARADVQLSIVSTAPTRPHFVAAGTATTFVVSARNTAPVSVTVPLTIRSSGGPSGDWQTLLFNADFLFRPLGSGSDSMLVTIPAMQTIQLLARVGAAASLVEGADGGAVVSAAPPAGTPASLELKARVRNRPKVYYVAIDGCGRGYLDLNRKGTRFDGTGERLMPRATAFAAARGARMTNASSVLPAVTDPNHTAALTGSWPGTLGIISVRNQYLGRDPQGHGVSPIGTRDLLRWGPEGHRVQSIFDVGKDPTSGGAASTFNAMVTGKDWLAELFRDGALDLFVDGKEYPDYIPAPQRYRLGDPPSDDDADQDREGTNLGGWLIKHLTSSEAMVVGSLPQSFPEDRWVGEAVVRVIQAEDPDVLYVDLGDADSAQHVFGAADRPEEWSDRGTPNILWDDENIYNARANRDPVLDVVHEADWDFGLVVDVLESRQTLDRSFVVLLSDHGLTTVMNTPSTELNPGAVLLDAGVSESDVEWIANRGEWSFLALTDPSKSRHIESILEAYEVFDPVQRTMVKPYIVINREEMDSGVDGVVGRFAEDGVAGNRRGELYSAWTIDVPVTDNSKVRWPDLILFTRNHFQTLLSDSTLGATSWVGSPFHGNHGSRRSAEVVLVASGPGIQPGVYAGAASLADIAPTLYRLLGVDPPANVDGRVLDEILAR